VAFVWWSMQRVGVLVALATAGLLAAAVSGYGGAAGHRAPVGSEASPDTSPAGTLVFNFRSNRLAAIDVATGRRTVRRVSSVAACGPELSVTGGHVIFGGVRGGNTVVFSAPISLDRAPKRLGGAHAFVPSATPGRVWLAGTDCNRQTMVGVREVTVDGRTTFASRGRLPGAWLENAVDGGLVLVRRRALAVWDPHTGTAGRPLPLAGAADAHGHLLYGCARRSRCREMLILDTATRGRVLVQQRRPYRLDLGGEFSPDGSLLAAPAIRDRRWSVALIHTRSGKTTIVPGSNTGSVYPDHSWAASSRWLFFRAGRGRMMAYRPGAGRAMTLPLRIPRRALGFVAG
jgi:hypothetical protein